MSDQTTNQPAPNTAGPPTESTMYFKVAGPDRRALTVLAIYLVILLWFAVTIVSDIADGQPPDNFSVVVCIFVAGMLLYRWLGSVRGYLIQWGAGPIDSRLTIRRLLPRASVSLGLDRLKRAYAEPELGPLLNTSIMSQGGLFGWVGTAQVTGLGQVQAYATNNKQTVVLELGQPESRWRRGTATAGAPDKSTLYVVSPVDPVGFAAELRRLPGVAGKAEVAATAKGPGGAAGAQLAATATSDPAAPRPAKKR